MRLIRLIPDRWKFDADGGFDMDRMNGHIAAWAAYLGLAGWEVRFSPLAPDPDSRASMDADTHHNRAVIRIDSDAPASQIDRLIVHELLHVAMAHMEDQFVRSLSEHGESAQAFLRGNWTRAEEVWIERLTSILTGTEMEAFADHRPSEREPWLSAFPADK